MCERVAKTRGKLQPLVVKDQGNLAALLIFVVLTRAKRRRRQPEPVISRSVRRRLPRMIGTTRSRVNLYKIECVHCDLVE